MTEIERVAYLNAQIICAAAEIEGMKAENAQRMTLGHSLAYNDESFFEIPEKYGIHQTAVFELFQGRENELV